MIRLCEEAILRVEEDGGHDGKIRQAKDRYQFVDEGR